MYKHPYYETAQDKQRHDARDEAAKYIQHCAELWRKLQAATVLVVQEQHHAH